MDPDQVGLLIVRVCAEPGSARPARLQLRATTDPSAGFTHTHTLTDIEQAITVIRAFLQTVLHGDTSSGRPAPGAVPRPTPACPPAGTLARRTVVAELPADDGHLEELRARGRRRRQVCRRALARAADQREGYRR